MVKSQYFCDRCNREVASNYGLYEITIQRPNINPTVLHACAKCVLVISDVALDLEAK
jgi:hypothetical protein